jgi:hypothetical protein
MSKFPLQETKDASELEGVPDVVTQIVAVVDEFGAKVMVYGQLPLGGAM